MNSLIDYVLAHGWDDDDIEALEAALALPGDEALEEALALFGECDCPPLEYCELVAKLLSDSLVRHS